MHTREQLVYEVCLVPGEIIEIPSIGTIGSTILWQLLVQDLRDFDFNN